MLFLAWVQWWYGRGWLEAIKRLKTKLAYINGFFSVGLLMRTLFKPWRQLSWKAGADSAPGQRMRTLVDNTVSRFVGLGVRLATLLAAVITMASFSLLGVAFIVAWPLLPAAVIWLTVRGING